MRRTIHAVGTAITVAATIVVVWLLSLDSKASRGRRPR